MVSGEDIEITCATHVKIRLEETSIGLSLAATTTQGLFMRSIDDCNTWTVSRIDPSSGSKIYSLGALKDHELYATATDRNSIGYYGISLDLGHTWLWRTHPFCEFFQVAWLGGPKLVAASRTGLYISSDQGKTWVECSNVIAKKQSFHSVVSFCRPGTDIWVAVAVGVTRARGLILYTEDCGVTWKEGVGKNLKRLNSVAVIPALTSNSNRSRTGETGEDAGTAEECMGWVAVGVEGQVIVSWNGGASWRVEETVTTCTLRTVAATLDSDGKPVVYIAGFEGMLVRGFIRAGEIDPVTAWRPIFSGEEPVGPLKFNALIASGNLVMAFGRSTIRNYYGASSNAALLSYNGGASFDHQFTYFPNLRESPAVYSFSLPADRNHGTDIGSITCQIPLVLAGNAGTEHIETPCVRASIKLEVDVKVNNDNQPTAIIVSNVQTASDPVQVETTTALPKRPNNDQNNLQRSNTLGAKKPKASTWQTEWSDFESDVALTDRIKRWRSCVEGNLNSLINKIDELVTANENLEKDNPPPMPDI